MKPMMITPTNTTSERRKRPASTIIQPMPLLPAMISLAINVA